MLLSLIVLAPGCAGPLKPVFPEPAVKLQWPPPPADARLRYVGALRGDADLRARRGGWSTVASWLVGKKAPQMLYGPRSVVTTPDGQRVWVADPGGRCLHLFDLETREYRKVTGMGSSNLLSPVGLCLGPPGTVLVCDSEAVSIHRFADRDGSWLGSLRLPEDLLRPVAAYYDAAVDELWVVDVSGHDLKVLNSEGALKRVVGRRGTGLGEFNYPCDIAAAADRLWIADTGNHRVQAIARDGQPMSMFGQAGDASGDLAMPKSVSVDSFGHVYVVDGRFENVQVFDSDGKLLLFFGEEGTEPGQFWLPTDVFIESTNRIWIADTYNRRLQVFEHVPAETSSNGVN